MMEIKRYLAVSLAIWLVFAALVGMTSRALPWHDVAGGVMGPGNDKSSAPTNPANAVGIVFYSTNQPSYTPIIGPDDFKPANDIDPAMYAVDVGNVWDWQDLDEMVAVFETTFNANGWTSTNYTTSLTAILHIGPPVEDIGNSTLEPFPTLSLLKGSNWILVSWSALTDAGNNVESYNLYKAATPAGPFNVIGTVADSPGVKSVNDTGLPMGPVCYQLSVNYRRDDLGNLYETAGRSTLVCTVFSGIPPRVTSTSPTDNQPNVPLGANIVITFSEPMDTPTVGYPITPSGIALTPLWTSGNTVLTLSHVAPFAICQSYSLDISGKDLDGNDLEPTPTVLHFTALCDFPYILTTSPFDGATAVRVTADIVITFSEEMSTGTVTYPTNPTIALTPTWSAGNTKLTLNHSAPFAAGTSYTVTVAGKDLDNNDLVAGPASNPWDFTTNNPPIATIDPTDTLVHACCDGGSGLTIPWTMSDIETPVGNLIVYLNYTMGASGGTIAGPLTNRQNSDSITWTTPIENGSAQILLEVIDGAGDKAQDISANVTIDSTPPKVLSVVPTNGSTNVPTDTQVVIKFSEPMQTSTVVISFNPVVTGFTSTWDNAHMNVTVGHPVFDVSKLYTMTVDGTARDNCTPGNQMGTANVTTFTTGTGVKAPKPPTNLVASAASDKVTLTWDAPTEYTDSSPLTVHHYDVYRGSSSDGSTAAFIGNSTAKTYIDSNVEQEKTYYYFVKAVDAAGLASDYSESASATVPKEAAGEFPWIWVIVIIIVILLVVGIVLLMRRKKPEAAPAEPIEGEQAPPEEEAPPEEAPAEETPPEEPSEEAPEQKPEGQ